MQKPRQDVEPVGPETLVEGQPLMGAGQRSRLQSAEMRAAAHLAPDQAGIFQHLYVFGSGCQRHVERLGQLRHSALAFGELSRSEEHTSELQSRENLVCRLLLEKKK